MAEKKKPSVKRKKHGDKWIDVEDRQRRSSLCVAGAPISLPAAADRVRGLDNNFLFLLFPQVGWVAPLG